jgi:ribosomal protein S18 acetylase RimI-like enzyme
LSLHITGFQPEDTEAVVRLWQDCSLVVPWNDPRRDIERKQGLQPELFLVGRLSGQLVASVMAGYDGHRGWLNYLAVSPGVRRRGLGRRMVAEAETRLRAMGCPKINLQVRTGNAAVIEFYRKVGFGPDDVLSMGKRLEHDE